MLPHFPQMRCIAFAALVFLTSAAAHAITRGTLNSPNVAEQLLLDQANQDRSQHSLPQLKRDPLLAQAALYHGKRSVLAVCSGVPSAMMMFGWWMFN